jgi:hypothetical protein
VGVGEEKEKKRKVLWLGWTLGALFGSRNGSRVPQRGKNVYSVGDVWWVHRDKREIPIMEHNIANSYQRGAEGKKVFPTNQKNGIFALTVIVRS